MNRKFVEIVKALFTISTFILVNKYILFSYLQRRDSVYLTIAQVTVNYESDLSQERHLYIYNFKIIVQLVKCALSHTHITL